MIIDSHCHLNYEALSSQLDEVLARAKAADVLMLQTICTKLSDVPVIKQIAEKYENIFCSIGVHPHEVEKEGIPSVDQLLELAKHKKVIGLGETGLDYYYEHSKRDLQIQSFINHIKASQLTQLPIIVHTRDADDDTCRILADEMQKAPFPGLIHCFSTTKKLADTAIELGMYISISGIITFKSASELRDIVKTLPLNRLLVETDSPYLAPIPMRGKSNEPAFIKYTVECLAELFEVSPSYIADVTTKNFIKLFAQKSIT